MNHRVGLPRSRIAAKLYGVIALTLVLAGVLAGVTIGFASRTEEAARDAQLSGLAFVRNAASLELMFEQQRRLVAGAALDAEQSKREQDERAFRKLTDSSASLMQRMGYGPADKLPERHADVAQLGAFALAYARDERRYQAGAMAADFATAMDEVQHGLQADERQRARATQAELEGIRASSRSVVAWVLAGTLASGLLIVPLGLFSLRRVMARLHGIGGALVRLARNDTSVDVPGVEHHDEVGQLARSVAVFKAKSIELLQKKAELERVNLQLEAAVNNMPLGLSMFDAQHRLLVCNRRYVEMYDLPAELTLRGTPYCALWEHREKKGALHYPAEGSREPDFNRPGSMTIEFGSEKTYSVARQPLKGGGWVALHEDITLRRRQEQEITHLARHDPLTNLANRSLFREQLQQALLRLGRGQGFAVLCLDLDRFKPVNDTLGHPVGDALLRQVSERLLSCVRQGDLVARLGGDEFAIIQANVRDSDSSEKLAARVVETVGKPYVINGHHIEISTSMGIVLAPRDGSDADLLMNNADLALYRTKADGRNGYSFFKSEMNEHVLVRRSLEADLRRALEEDGLSLWYQPAVCLKRGTVTGLEALLRWTHPARGTIAPAEFIALAEESGLMGEVGDWALRRACMEAARWSSPARVAINLSPLQIKRNLTEVVLQALADSGLAPSRLELQITEAVLMQDSHNTLAMLHQLRQLGVRIVMDNFGRGYCSVSYLRSFPFDKVKVDRALIAGMDRSAPTRAVIAGIVGMGNGLRMSTVAEGIENFAQLQAVRGFGCSEAQGYFFSPAVAGSEVERLLADTFEQARDAA
ncbi:MAG: EAL domain-containing protein [Hyphomicrobiaceae bacterium]